MSTSTTLLKTYGADPWWPYHFQQSHGSCVVVDEIQTESWEKIAAIVSKFNVLVGAGDYRQRKWNDRQYNGEGILFIALPCFFQNRHVAASHP